MDDISPFEYNRIVTGHNFIGMDAEAVKLSTLIKERKNALLYGPPKIGKRSIVHGALLSLKRESANITICTIDLFNIRHADTFMVRYANTLISPFATSRKDWKAALQHFIPDSGFSIEEGTNGKFRLRKNSDEPLSERQIEQILGLSEDLSQSFDTQIIVYFLQFQDITLIERPAKMMSIMERHIAKHQDASFIIVGDKRNAMDDIFIRQKYLHNSITRIEIPQIDKKTFSNYIVKCFATNGKLAQKLFAGEIYDAVEGDPWYTQHLAEICFLLTKDSLTEDIVQQGIKNLISIHDYELHNTVFGISTSQLSMLSAILDGVTKFARTETMVKYQMHSSANVNRIKKALVKKEIVSFVDKNTIEFNDTLLKYWLKNYFFKE